MKALILAAGYARRLYPITKEYPKPLLLVGGCHLIDYIVEKLEKIKKIDEILLVTNKKFFSQFMQWKKKIKCSKAVKLINDSTETYRTRLGAIGDINFVIKKKDLKDDLLVIGGDNLFDADLGEFISYASKNGPYASVGLYDIKEKAKASHYGVAHINRERQIVGFEEKPLKPKSSLVAMCLYYFPKERLSLISEYLNCEDKKHDATGFYINWLHKKTKVFAFVFNGRWYDIGQPDFYKKAKKAFEEQA